MTSALRIALAGMLLTLAACATKADSVRQPTIGERISALVSHRINPDSTPGLAIAVAEAGRTTFEAGFGAADAERGMPVTKDTLFNVASVSKPVTALGVLRLAEAGSIDLDRAVTGYTARWTPAAPEGRVAEVSVRRVLGHKAGLSMPSVPWVYLPEEPPTVETLLNRGWKKTEPLTVGQPPGESWNYSGGGYALLELMVEDVTGRPFEAYMREAVFEPLGMRRTSFSQNRAQAPATARGYDDEGAPDRPYRMVGASAGGLYSSVSDFARLTRAYHCERDCIAPPADLVAEIAADPAPVSLAGVDPAMFGGAVYGLGHGVHRTADGRLLLYHSGGNPGFMAYFIVEPASGNSLTMFANGAEARDVMDAVRRLWAAEYGYDLPHFF